MASMRTIGKSAIRSLRGCGELASVPRQLPGCLNANPSATRRVWQSDQEFVRGYHSWRQWLGKLVRERHAASIMKFGDGDYHFLVGSPVGSAKPGRRALSLPYADIDHESFRVGATECDFYACESNKQARAMFARALPDCQVTFPAEYCYAAVASRWIFSLCDSIVLVGADEKLALIEQLMSIPEYRAFLGVRQFEMVRIPQRFACDNLEAVKRSVASQLQDTASPLVLTGVGHVKSGLLFELPRVRPAVYLDIGSGIDALAGVINPKRPFFADWTNFQFRDQSIYRDIDLLQVSDFGVVKMLDGPSEDAHSQV